MKVINSSKFSLLKLWNDWLVGVPEFCSILYQFTHQTLPTYVTHTVCMAASILTDIYSTSIPINLLSYYLLASKARQVTGGLYCTRIFCRWSFQVCRRGQETAIQVGVSHTNTTLCTIVKCCIIYCVCTMYRMHHIRILHNTPVFHVCDVCEFNCCTGGLWWDQPGLVLAFMLIHWAPVHGML